jgi:hypothetical protein
MSGSVSARVWAIARPCPGCGTRYGLRAVYNRTDEVMMTRSRDDFVSAAGRLARLAAGGSLDWDYAHDVVTALGAEIGRPYGEPERTWRWAESKGRANPDHEPTAGRMATRGDIVDRLLGWQRRVWLDAELHTHRCAGSAVKVLDAFLLEAVRANRLELSWSVRQIAEAAGLCAGTVCRTRPVWCRHVNRLRAGSRRTGDPSTWRLIAPDPTPTRRLVGGQQRDRPEAIGHGLRELSRSCPTPPGVHRGELSDPGANYWVRGGHKRRVWLTLDDREPLTAREVWEACHRSPTERSVRRLLVGLEADELVVRTVDGGWLRVPNAAEPVGVNYAAHRRARHEAERVAWRRTARPREWNGNRPTS